MSDDKKTLKFQMMMSPDEARELDDWMFKNRLRSRAEAIRRLCQMGLVLDKELESISDSIETIPDHIDEYENILFKYVDRSKIDEDQERIVVRYSLALISAMSRHFNLLKKIVKIGHNFRKDDELTQLIERAKKIAERVESGETLFDYAEKRTPEAER